MDVNRVFLYARTVRHLRASQGVHRARLRGQRAVVTRVPGIAERMLRRPSPRGSGWPAEFRPVDAELHWPTLHQLESGEMSLLGSSREFGDRPDWHQRSAPQLWRYHLHYWDWAWGLVQAGDRERARAVYTRLFESWQDQISFGQGDAWSPYVVALRAWSWCGQYDAMVRESGAEPRVLRLLGLHAGYLRAHLELDVGGNHLIKDLKALVGLGVFLHDEAMYRRAIRRLEREVQRQVLADGGHFERAPAYHCQVLADLIDVAGLLRGAAPAWLAEAIDRMRAWLGVVLLPDGTVPLLNDGFPVPAALLSAVQPGPTAPRGLTMLDESGLAVMRRGPWFVLADIGLPCPDDLPAHAHADTLGFLCYLDERRLVGECGTSTYEAGRVRSYERGTAAHSTVQVDGADSTEVWGAFRAGRRARPQLLWADDDSDATVVSACHDGYRHLTGKPVHTRTWTLTDAAIRVVDGVTGDGEHDLVVRLHETPPSSVSAVSALLENTVGEVAVGWHRRGPSSVLEHATRAKLPWRFEIELGREERR